MYRTTPRQQLEHISRACGVPDAESALALLSRAQAQREELSGAQAQVEALQKQLSVTRRGVFLGCPGANAWRHGPVFVAPRDGISIRIGHLNWPSCF